MVQNRPHIKEDDRKAQILGDSDPPPYEVFNENGKARCLIVCDHAGNAIPESLNKLGLSDEELEQHCAIDIGARGVAREMSERLDAPCIMANYSRLLIDLNRYPDHPTFIVDETEGGPVSGNASLSDDDIAARMSEIYEPYHAEIERITASFREEGVVPVVISVHSFTEKFFKQKRPWEVGILWVRDDRLPVPVMETLRKKGFVVGDNEPYDARMLWGKTVSTHADAHGFPNLLFEVRNDLISTEAAEKKNAGILVESLSPVLSDDSLYTFYQGEELVKAPPLAENYFDELIKKAKKGE